MPNITYRAHGDHPEKSMQVDTNSTVMRAAILNGVRGIIGECGGQAMCATCHVYVESSSHVLPEVSEDEAEMLECTAAERLPESRLSCQLPTSGFDELIVRIPDRQL